MQAVRWIGLAFVLLIVYSTLIYGIMVIVVPLPPPPPERTIFSTADSLLQYEWVSREELARVVHQFKTHRDSLSALLNRSIVETTEKNRMIDSLSNELNSHQAALKKHESEVEYLSKLLNSDKDRADKARDIAKTFSSMDTKQIAPILNKLDNETVIAIYEQMNSRTRKNILLGLPQERAALITKKMLD